MIPCLWSVVPSTSLIKRKNPRTILVTTINVVTLPCLSFYLLNFSVSLFSYEMSHHQKMKTSTYFLFCTQSLFSCHTKREVEIVESEREGVYCVSKWNKPRKGVALGTCMYPQKAMIRKFLGLKVICALTNWIATTMLMDFLLRIISSDMSLLKEVVRITITFNSHCPRAAFEKLRQAKSWFENFSSLHQLTYFSKYVTTSQKSEISSTWRKNDLEEFNQLLLFTFVEGDNAPQCVEMPKKIHKAFQRRQRKTLWMINILC